MPQRRHKCPLWVDTVEKVVSDPPKRNNRTRTARYLNRNCVRGRDFESMLRIQGRKIVFQQYRPKADIGRTKFDQKSYMFADLVFMVCGLSGKRPNNTRSHAH